ncbi:HU domain-containing protein [Salinimicrobium oceani]|uniref:SPOR domain-containing protein n=1 Tax=Salinimicrobium oceani TaxID=2722702 RepID=A0ABX1CUQ2_9FLAO|nr:SPOR domain-containing protein [Salinimicrobium oceani]NJW52026.1 SPOR domain-containing protein [Salinimicrobium oceani]
MAVATYIHDLLYRYECVILPGFGAFITQQHSARIHEATNEFFPPKKTVSFNRQLIKNDGLLANYIVEAEKTSYEKAIEKIATFVEELELLLEEKKPISFDQIGSFTLSKDHKLQFEPATQTNYLKEAFGLCHFTSNTLNREVYKEQAVAIEEKAPVAFTPERRAGGRWMKYAAVGLLAVGLSGAAGFNFYSDQVSEHNLAEQQKAASQLESQIQQATFVIDNPLPAVTLKVSKQVGNYHIVAGAFREEENAAKAVEELKAEGFKARQIGVNRFGLHQVLSSSHESRRDAINELYRVKKTNPGAWLLVQEL